jgi:hypothetical protein
METVAIARIHPVAMRGTTETAACATIDSRTSGRFDLRCANATCSLGVVKRECLRGMRSLCTKLAEVQHLPRETFPVPDRRRCWTLAPFHIQALIEVAFPYRSFLDTDLSHQHCPHFSTLLAQRTRQFLRSFIRRTAAERSGRTRWYTATRSEFKTARESNA